MTISLALLLIPYLALLIFFLILLVVNIYHVRHFGSFDTRNQIVVICLLVYSAVILSAAAVYLLSVDWSQSWTVSLPVLSNTAPSL